MDAERGGRATRELPSETLQRAFVPLPSGSMLRYEDGFTRLYMPGGRRDEGDVAAAIVVKRIACRHIALDSGGYR